ncbi:MAG: metallophosphoesterase [Clostridia bacterium]|nr:metallophosphoesterase [Clostridia bacterium]
MKTRKQWLAILLAIGFLIQMVPLGIAADTATIGWEMRSEAKSFNLLDDGAGITSMNEAGEVVTPEQAAALMTQPLGYEAFEVKFDLTWSASNLSDGQSGYGSSFVYLFLNSTGSIADSGTSAYPAKNQISIKDRHVDGREISGATKAGVISLGLDSNNQRVTFKNLNADMVTECHLSLANNVLTFAVYKDGAVLKTYTITYNEGTLNPDAAKYLGVAVYKNHAFSIRNVEILSTDYMEQEEPDEGGDDVVYEGKWEMREMDKGFVTTGVNGITTLREDGNASAGSAAIWNEAVGTTRFRASFDLIWNNSNLTEGQPGYLDNFLSIYVTDSVAFPAGSGAFLPSPGFRVETKHFQAEDKVSAITSTSAAIVDFGGKTLNDMNEGNRSTLYIELMNGVLSLYVKDGDTMRGKISYTFDDSYFTADKPQYIGFALYGSTIFSVENFTIHDVSDENIPETNSQQGKGFDFRGSNTYMLSEEAIAAPSTIEAWVKIPANVGNTTYVGTLFETNEVTFMGATDGNPRVLFGGSGLKVTSVDLRTNSWTHLAFVCDREQGKILCYVNGELAGSKAATVKELTTSSTAILGNVKNKMTSTFHGEAADLRLWSDVRTAEEIKANMSATVPTDAEGLIANYLLTEGGDVQTDRTGKSSDLLVKKRVTFVEEPEEGDYDYTIAVIPDTQIMTGGYTSHSAYTALTTWLKENKESEKIAFALHVGDLVNDPNDTQFTLAKQAMDILDGYVPYAFVPGNHDYDTDSSTKRDTSVFNKYFPYAKYKEFSDFGGAYEEGKMDNTYWFFDAGEEKYMVVALEFGPRDSVLEWAGEITAANPDRHVIVITHGSLYNDGELMDETSENTPTNYLNGGYLDVPGDPANHGEGIWEKYASKYANIDMVISGHIYTDNIVTRYEVGDHGNKVCHMLVNAQRLDFDMWLDQEYFGADGLGMIALMRFSNGGNTVSVSYYSPYLDKYVNEVNQFTLSLGEDGSWVDGCYYVDGEAVKGLYKIDGDYYYFNTGSGKMMADRTIWVKADNAYGLAADHYVLGADGKLEVVKNGWLTNDKGLTFYYVNDERVKGLYEIDGDYYYFNTGSGLLTVNKTIWVAKSNAYGLAAGNYELGADGKLVVPVLNGWVGNYYYVDGEAVKGVYKIDGVYYYFHHASGLLQTNKTVWIKADNACGLAAGNYELTADGVIVL